MEMIPPLDILCSFLKFIFKVVTTYKSQHITFYKFVWSSAVNRLNEIGN